MPRRTPFPTDRGLTARMVVAAVATPLVVAAAVVAVVAVAPLKIVIGLGIAAVVGIVIAVRERVSAPAGTEVGPDEAPELHAIVERLCVVADLPKPRIVVERERQPNSWVVSLGRGNARLHVTTALIERLEPAELEAVIGHELAHVAHRDATVMTVVGGPGAVLAGGGARIMRNVGVFPMNIGAGVALGIGRLAGLGSLALSRYREFAADAGAVALTGNPAALASALMKVSDGVHALPSRDLRAVAARDPFHLLPVGREPRVLATHPSLEARIARLERLEAQLQTFRP